MAKYDLVLKGGLVLDAAAKLEAVRDVGIQGGRIAAVEEELDPTQADDVLDVSGRWVMPGLIDTHVHVAGFRTTMDPAIGLKQLAEAGTTTALDLGGTMDQLVDGVKRRGSGINVGGLHILIPGNTIGSDEPPAGMIRDTLGKALKAGSLGFKILGGYYPFSPEKSAEIIQICNEEMAWIALHCGTKASGSTLHGMREVPELVGKGRLHVAHINAYCRGLVRAPVEECQESLDILKGMRGQVVSEVHLGTPNATNGRCDANGNVMHDVARNCLKMGGYPTTAEGVRRAILDGYASAITQKGGRIVLVKGEEALNLWESQKTNASLSFPVNLALSAFLLTVAKDEEGRFIVDAVSTDGGMFPRNIAIERTMALVRFGALSPLEMVAKLSWNPSRMLGLLDKGHLSPGADADVTVIDPQRGKAVMGIVAGKLIMLNGRSIASGGTLLVTKAGEQATKEWGLPYQVVDLSHSQLYAGWPSRARG